MKELSLNGKRIQLVAGLHGNERAPVRALTDTGYAFTLGNPQAFEKNVRFVDTDLNASFGTNLTSYEAMRAKELLELLPESDYVIDFHTTRAKAEPFVILTDLSMLPLARLTGLQKAVHMAHNPKNGHALINHRNGISVEMTGYDTEESYETTLRVLANIEKNISAPIEVYEVYDKITEQDTYENFVLHESGFYPLFVGETSYDFIGLKARKLDI